MYMCQCYSLNSSPRLFPLCIPMSILYICVSIPALQIAVHIYSEVLLSHKKEWNWIMCSDVDRPRICRIEWSQKNKYHILTNTCGINVTFYKDQHQEQCSESMVSDWEHQWQMRICQSCRFLGSSRKVGVCLSIMF